MYRTLAFLAILCSANGANYERYDSSTRFPNYQNQNYQNQNYQNQNYQSYSTIANLNQYPYKTGTYGSDIVNFPEATRYPNYSPGYNSYSTNGYNTYSTPRPATFYQNNQNSYSTPRYGGDGYGRGYSPYEVPFMKDIRDYCVNRTPQTRIWVDNLMGMWYGVEYIQHLAGDSRVDYGRTCIVMHIAEPIEQPSTENQLFHVQHMNAKFRQEYRHLRLLWDEAGQTIEYALYFRNDSAGYWQVFDGQNGTIPYRQSYQQFSGTVQVLKAVNDHLLLNFCQEPTNGKPAQLYSVLFSREPGLMPRWEVDSVHSLLQNKKLSVASRRMVCGNSATKVFHSLFLTFILFALSYAVKF